MADVHGLINALRPEDLPTLQKRGADQILDCAMVDALDRAPSGPGEGRGDYIFEGSVEPMDHRLYRLRADAAAALFVPSSAEGAFRADIE